MSYEAGSSYISKLRMVAEEPAYLDKSHLSTRLKDLCNAIKSIDHSIAHLRQDRDSLSAELEVIQQQLDTLPSTNHTDGPHSKRMQPILSGSGIDYTQEFDWSAAIKTRMAQIFGINTFRLCQEGVCNASMDGRDVVCVMPTGGGKSLTFQLPAVMNSGCTLVISPLLSLITDQILHLREAGVEAVMLTGGTSNEESKNIFSRLTATARGGSSVTEIKLCYVTPEKIAKSKKFMALLEKLASAGKLSRIVIDEAHCVSQLGHDFRPDYKKLSVLKQFFPHVPILALSATCPPKVLADLLKVLRLKPVVDGKVADQSGTVYFSAPLYRKNLHYRVLLKPSSSSAVIKAMVDYILAEHPHDSGIVYCLSKKDTETVAQGIMDVSDNKIKAGVYHSEVNDAQKERLHVSWRSGEIQIVCATIAFGLGIDKSNVRFVLHHSMSKSLDGFYQESGRAGRDGKDSDCVLFYRGQDASRLSALLCDDVEGQDKLHDMLRFAQDMRQCRKLQFANYFSASSSLSFSSWSDSADGVLASCGHCDNCTRMPDSVFTRDVTTEAWQILQNIDQLNRNGTRTTIGMLADLVRGVGSGAITTVGRKGKGRGELKGKIALDLDDVAGGKITMSKDDVETLIIDLILSKYLREDFHANAYSVNVYIVAGPQALRLTRLSRTRVDAGEGARIICTFPVKAARKRKSAHTVSTSRQSKKAKLAQVENQDERSSDDQEIPESDDVDPPHAPLPSKPAVKRKSGAKTAGISSSASKHRTIKDPPVVKRRRSSGLSARDEIDTMSASYGIEDDQDNDNEHLPSDLDLPLALGKAAQLTGKDPAFSDSDEDGSLDDLGAEDWSFSIRGHTAPSSAVQHPFVAGLPRSIDPGKSSLSRSSRSQIIEVSSD